MGAVKTTVELPDDLFRDVKATAARRGETLREYIRAALEERLDRERTEYQLRERAAVYRTAQPGTSRRGAPTPGLARADDGKWPYPPDPLGAEEHRVIDQAIEEAFERINPDTWK